MDSNLLDAFRFHRQTGSRAARAIALARADVAAGKRRYPGSGRSYLNRQPGSPNTVMPEPPEAFGFREVGRVNSGSRRRDIWDSRGSSGWITDPDGDYSRDGTGLVWGVVYQLPGRDGVSRFVPGYQFGGTDGGPCLDLSAIQEEPRGDGYAAATDLDAARDAARIADGMAETAAEVEREYQTAWRAGRDWADAGEEIADSRREALALIRELKALRAKVDPAEAPNACAAIRAAISRAVRDIAKARDKRAKLAGGDAEGLYFWPREERLRLAFCDGAGLDAFPA